MAYYTLQNCFDASRAYLNDIQVAGGETYTNTFLQLHFAEAWRRVWRGMSNSGSKRVEHLTYLNLPAGTTVINPSTYNITDFAEPSIIEERLASSPLTIVSTSTDTPIKVTINNHGLSGSGYGMVSGVQNTMSPWGYWGFTVLDANTISLNGSQSDGVAGSGGVFTTNSALRWTEVQPADRANQTLDGQPSAFLGSYLWTGEQLLFRGCVNTQQLRITYWSSGAAPTNSSTLLGIDDVIDFVACATAANAAAANGFAARAQTLTNKAYGQSQDPDEPGGLFLEFLVGQVKLQQKGPPARRGPFRLIRGKFGQSVLGS